MRPLTGLFAFNLLFVSKNEVSYARFTAAYTQKMHFLHSPNVTKIFDGAPKSD
jgi:hypothetical protein